MVVDTEYSQHVTSLKHTACSALGGARIQITVNPTRGVLENCLIMTLGKAFISEILIQFDSI
jgi:hypothetical protein